jgi:hypothetical protein
MIDPASKTKKADRSKNYWDKYKIELRIKAAKVLSQQRYNTDDLTSLSDKQLKEIVKIANTKPNLILKGKVK